MTKNEYIPKINEDVKAEDVGLAEVEEEAIKVVKTQLKKKIIKRKKVEMIISEWSDLPTLVNRIEYKYGATIVSQNESCVIFKGKLFEVTLKKI